MILIAGPCAIEDSVVCHEIASEVSKICNELEIEYIFKGSFKKANRTKLNSFTGIGLEKSMEIFASIKEKYNVKTITDVHETIEIPIVSETVDYLQIPAFLCRQTDLILKAAEYAKDGVCIKKGQFMSPDSMEYAYEKAISGGSKRTFVMERGTTFGYNDLVVDFTSIPSMSKFSDVIMDCTHATQKPNQTIGVTGGNPEMIETLAKCAIVSGASGLFIETHPNPSVAKSDSSNMLELSKLKDILKKCIKINNLIK